MFTPEFFLENLENRISQIASTSSPERLYAPIRYILKDGGKRMRPLLTLMAANIYNDSIDGAYTPAMGLEVFHNFTLLHDDIMDRASLRRGRDTVHVRWSDNVAILSGDAMVILAYQLLTTGTPADKLSDVLTIFNQASLEVCEGQQLDMDFETQSTVSIPQYLEMIHLKTSVLMAAALEIGALIGGADLSQRQAIYNFGINLGLAFQIQDDILDTYGDQSTFGKTIGGDIAVGKKTFLYLTAEAKANAEQLTTLRTNHDYHTIRTIYDDLHVKSDADKAVETYFDHATEALHKCHAHNERLQAMTSYANSLLQRNK